MTSRIVAGVLLLTLASIAHADDDWREWPLGDRLKLSLGVYLPDLDTVTTVSEVDGLEGTEIDFEDDLALDDDESTFFGSLEWRFLKRNKLTFNYYSLERDATTRTQDVIIFDGTIFPPGIGVDSFINADIYELNYSFSFIFSERMNLAAGVGISAQDYEIGIASTLIPQLREEEDFVAPLPTLNLEFQYALTDNWSIDLQGGWLDAEFDINDNEVDGRIITANAGLRWKVFKYLGVTAGYTYFDLDGDFSDSNTEADIAVEYKGPQLTVDLFF